MRFPRSKTAPMTDNVAAAALIRRATQRCAGCRINWRLKGWDHYGGKGVHKIECDAKEERQALRDIAAQNRGRKAPRLGAQVDTN